MILKFKFIQEARFEILVDLYFVGKKYIAEILKKERPIIILN